MQAVILAAGQSTRFYPLGRGEHKSFFPLLGLTILEHTVKRLQELDVASIILVISPQHESHQLIKKLKESYPQVKVVIQKEAKGMGNALLCAEEYLERSFFVLHAHHVDITAFFSQMKKKRSTEEEIVLLAKEAEQFSRFGVLTVQGDKVTDLVEKPEEMQDTAKLCVVGIYLLNREFMNILKQTEDEHYNFEKAIAAFATKQTARALITTEEVVSLKFAWDLLQMNRYLLEHSTGSLAPTASVHESAVVSEEAIIEDGVTIHEHVSIKGPCFIGRGSIVGNNAILRGCVSVGRDVVVGAQMELKNAVLSDNVTTHSGFIGDSVIDEGTKLAAYFCTGNVRLDRKSITVETVTGSIDSKLKSLGAIIGNHVSAGIRVSTMPGILIGEKSVIGPSTTVYQNIAEDMLYYAKFEGIISKKVTSDRAISSEKKEETEKVVLFDIDYTLFDTARFKQTNLVEYSLYEEVPSVLSQLQKIAKLGIFSEGETEFQRAKLIKTQIHSQFHEDYINIVEKKEYSYAEMLQRFDKSLVFLIDDKLPVLHDAKRQFRDVVTIWIKRGPFAENQQDIPGFEPDAIVTSLAEAVPVIANTY